MLDVVIQLLPCDGCIASGLVLERPLLLGAFKEAEISRATFERRARPILQEQDQGATEEHDDRCAD